MVVSHNLSCPEFFELCHANFKPWFPSLRGQCASNEVLIGSSGITFPSTRLGKLGCCLQQFRLFFLKYKILISHPLCAEIGHMLLHQVYQN